MATQQNIPLTRLSRVANPRTEHRSVITVEPEETPDDVTKPLLPQDSPEVNKQTELTRRLENAEDYVGPRYALKKTLGLYIPESNPEHIRAQKSFRVRRNRRSAMLGIQLAIASTVVLINLCVTLWAFARYPPVDGVGTLFYGDCTFVNRLNGGIHVLLNILSSAFLAAGNYCMQVLVAPSAAEMWETHKSGRYFDIGMTATMLHLVWNSAVFSATPFTIVPMAVATNDFLTFGDEWNLTNPTQASKRSPWGGPSVSDLQQAAKGFTRLDNMQCMNAFIEPLDVTQELVVIVNRTTSDDNSTSLLSGWINGSPSDWDGSSLWICSYFSSPKGWAKSCPIGLAETFAENWRLNGSWINDKTVEHCLVGAAADNEGRCAFQYSAYLVVFVLFCTIAELAVMGWIASQLTEPTLVLLGDAISAALQGPS